MKLTLLLGPVLALWTAGAAFAQGEIVPPVPCSTPEEMIASPNALTRVGARIADAAPIKVVALGSSSTYGSGATTPGGSYPSQLEGLLHESLPRSPIVVINKGVPGERVADMMARFGRDVLDLQPDLLIWQTGTNSTLGHADINAFAAELNRGVGIARAAGIDLILLTPQYSSAVIAVPEHVDYLARMAAIASERRIALFRRFEIMRYWQEVGRLPAESLTGNDGLHMTDLGYACMARALSRMIVKLARPPESRPAPAQIALPFK
jgi:lysophospholipase L1-like esterase